MKKFIAALALTTAAFAVPAFSGVGVSIRIGEPGFYGQLDIDSGYSPRLIRSAPVIIDRRPVLRGRYVQPVYLRVPQDHSRNWKKYCNRYDACGRPVYFVRDDWYRDVYVPRYRDRHAHDRRDDRRDDRHDRRDDRHDDRHDNRNDRRDDHHDDRHDNRNDRRDDRHDEGQRGRH